MKQLVQTAMMMVLAAGYCPVMAQVHLDGSTQSVLYLLENAAENRQTDYYQYLNLRIIPEHYSRLNFRTYLRVGRLGDPAEWNEKIHNAYLDWQSSGRRFGMRLGRQFLYNGVVNGTVDGLLISTQPVKKLTIKAVAGTGAPAGRTMEMNSWEDDNLLGGYVSYGVADWMKMDLSYVRKSRDGETIWNQAGTAFSGKFAGSLFYQAQADYNIAASYLQGMRYRLSYYHAKWNLFAEANNQKPRIYEDSFFRIFELEAYTQLRTGISYRLGDYRIGVLYYYTVLNEGESNNQAHLTAGSRYGMIGVLYQDGFSGDNAGVYGDIHYNILRDLQVRVTSSYYKYQRYMVVTSEEATAFSAGLNYTLLDTWRIHAEVQNSMNSVYDRDLRGLVRLTYSFDY